MSFLIWIGNLLLFAVLLAVAYGAFVWLTSPRYPEDGS